MVGSPERFEQVEIEPVAHPDRRGSQRLAGLATEQRDRTRTAAHQLQTAPLRSPLVSGQGHRQGGGTSLPGPGALDPLLHQQAGRPPRLGRRLESGGLGHAWRAHLPGHRL